MCMKFFFFNEPATTEIYTLSLHDALPIYIRAAALGLGEELLGGHEDHGPSREGEGVGQDRPGQYHGRSPEYPGDRLDHRGELTVEEAPRAGHPFTPQGHGHRGALGEVLQPDADGQRYRRTQGSPGNALRDAEAHGAEGDAYRQPLRNVVQRYGRYEEHAPAPARVDALGLRQLHPWVQVR